MTLINARAYTVVFTNSSCMLLSTEAREKSDSRMPSTRWVGGWTWQAACEQTIFLYRDNPNLKLAFGPGGRSHPDLDPDNFEDVKKYVAAFDPLDNVYFTRLIINHWGGTCPLLRGRRSGVGPSTLLVKGTENIHVVDASLHPAPLSAHPVATIMAVAEKASDVLLDQI